MYKIKVKKINEHARLPEYAHPGDAGMDVFSAADMILQPGGSALIPTGIKIELPPDTEAQIRPRSGLALKDGITVLNTPGTIDEGYRGEVGIILINHSKKDFHITTGMKIAQMVIKPVFRAEIEEVDKLGETSRGEGGFGSTGK